MLILSIFMQLAFSAHQEGFQSSVPNEDLRGAWDAVVQIEHEITIRHGVNRGTQTFLGSGVIVHKVDDQTAYIVTNAHVVSCQKRARCRTKILLTNNKSSQFASNVHYEYYDATRDAALIRINADFRGIEPITVAENVPNYFDKVYAIGFPDISIRKKWQGAKTKYKRNRKYISQGHFMANMRNVSHDGYTFLDGSTHSFFMEQLYKHSADTMTGNSGGALVNEQGELLAINTGISSTKRMRNQPYCYNSGTNEPTNLGCYYISLPAFLLKDIVLTARHK